MATPAVSRVAGTSLKLYTENIVLGKRGLALGKLAGQTEGCVCRLPPEMQALDENSVRATAYFRALAYSDEEILLWLADSPCGDSEEMNALILERGRLDRGLP